MAIGNKIISSFFGGAGDNMQFSTLPRRFTELGYKVYLSSKCAFRNNEIKELVWDLNPYIVGESDEKPNAGDGAGFLLEHATDCFLGNWERVHGLPEPYSKYPELYYKPKFIKGVEDKTLIDITATSGQKYYEAEPIRKYIKENTDYKDSIICTFHDGIAIPMLIVDGYPCVFVENLFFYCDLIHSCKNFISLHAGGMVLASALQAKCDCLVTKTPIHTEGIKNHHHFYDNINYIWI